MIGLLNDFADTFTVINVVTTTGKYGDPVTTYTDGQKITGVLSLDTSTPMVIAQAQGVNNVYKFTTEKSVNLPRHTILRRESDKKTFRITNDGNDNHTPRSANLDMRQCRCEEWVIPSE
jgi:hypothetical protein